MMMRRWEQVQQELDGLSVDERSALASRLDTSLGLLAFADMRESSTVTIDQMVGQQVINRLSVWTGGDSK